MDRAAMASVSDASSDERRLREWQERTVECKVEQRDGSLPYQRCTEIVKVFRESLHGWVSVLQRS